LKESLIKNKNLKKIFLDNENIEETDILDEEYYLVYKLVILTDNYLHFNFSKNMFFSITDLNLKLNYLKCYIDEINHLFFNFHHFDIYLFFHKK
jgi:hypothetical protein